MRSRRVLFTGLLLLLFFVGTTAWADPLFIGEIDLNNLIPSGVTPGEDQLIVNNYTGGVGDVLDPLTFTNAVLTVNGSPLPALSDIAAGSSDSSVTEPTTSITSLNFSATFLGEPSQFTVNLTGGGTELIQNRVFFCGVDLSVNSPDCAPPGSLGFGYSGAALDSSNGPFFALYADAPSAIPEPATLSLLGLGLLAVWTRKRNRA